MSPAHAGKFTDGKKFASLLSSDEPSAVMGWVDSMYNKMHLDSFGLQHDVFFYACKGYQYLLSQNKLQRPEILTICDYSQLSSSKRLYVIDMVNGQILFNTYVSHGKNSGKEYANSFSNRNNSHKSSLGFLVTADTYRGKSGYSMHFDGMETGINDHVRARNIVLHGSFYVNGFRADEGTLMGRSYGCPAVPFGEHEEIIDNIKGGSCFFIYSPDYLYTRASRILNAHFDWPVLLSLNTAAPAAPASNNIAGINPHVSGK
jgi:hypothetical protein